jgi:hypothetical protein
MRKIASNSYNNYQHSNSIPFSINKQQTSTGYSRQNINNSSQLNSDNHINDEKILIKKHLWNRSASKDG